MSNLFDAHYLFASLIWGSIGMGYFVYGKRQQSLTPWIGGVLIIAASYFADSALLMSLICIGIMIAVHWLVKRGG
jgi:hypothetical protein